MKKLFCNIAQHRSRLWHLHKAIGNPFERLFGCSEYLWLWFKGQYWKITPIHCIKQRTKILFKKYASRFGKQYFATKRKFCFSAEGMSEHKDEFPILAYKASTLAAACQIFKNKLNLWTCLPYLVFVFLSCHEKISWGQKS